MVPGTAWWALVVAALKAMCESEQPVDSPRGRQEGQPRVAKPGRSLGAPEGISPSSHWERSHPAWGKLGSGEQLEEGKPALRHH